MLHSILSNAQPPAFYYNLPVRFRRQSRESKISSNCTMRKDSHLHNFMAFCVNLAVFIFIHYSNKSVWHYLIGRFSWISFWVTGPLLICAKCKTKEADARHKTCLLFWLYLGNNIALLLHLASGFSAFVASDYILRVYNSHTLIFCNVSCKTPWPCCTKIGLFLF